MFSRQRTLSVNGRSLDELVRDFSVMLQVRDFLENAHGAVDQYPAALIIPCD